MYSSALRCSLAVCLVFWSSVVAADYRIESVKSEAFEDFRIDILSDFSTVDDKLFMVGRTLGGQAQLFWTDGAELNHVANSSSDAIRPMVGFGGELYFNDVKTSPNSLSARILRTDGTSITPVLDQNASLARYHIFGQELYFSANEPSSQFDVFNLYKTSGESATALDAPNDVVSNWPHEFAQVGGELYIGHAGRDRGMLVRTDGARSDIVTGADVAVPSSLFGADDQVYFAGRGPTGIELYAADGLNATLVADVNTAGDANPRGLVNYNGSFLFSAQDALGNGLFSTTGDGATKIADVGPVFFVRDLGDRALFVAGLDGELQIYETDGETFEPFSTRLPSSGSDTLVNDHLYIVSRVQDGMKESFSLFQSGANEFVEVATNVLESKLHLIGEDLFFGGYTEEGITLFKLGDSGLDTVGLITDDRSEAFMSEFMQFRDDIYFAMTANGETELFRVSQVPEPSSMLLLAIGLLAIGCRHRLQRAFA